MISMWVAVRDRRESLQSSAQRRVNPHPQQRQTQGRFTPAADPERGQQKGALGRWILGGALLLSLCMLVTVAVLDVVLLVRGLENPGDRFALALFNALALWMAFAMTERESRKLRVMYSLFFASFILLHTVAVLRAM
ncbi:hypothetical protein [Streptomyces tauricus]|uniref:hypothetical protein n=1 Tax=Streptomyces tauricus TaxID=68274 RepID=UPI002244D07B|nr:hypothetical protein [Streptomyces tauricus]MCW8101710.1 hypothetical protein [Streptomyces tauricus]